MDALKWLFNSKIPVLTKIDIAKITGFKDPYLKVYLNRLVRSGKIRRVERGKYTICDNPFLVASCLTTPAYISFLSAFMYMGLTVQVSRVIHVVTVRRKKPVYYEGFKIIFVRFKPDRIFGYKRVEEEGKYLFIADLEKAIVDSLYNPRYCPVTEVHSILYNATVNIDKLIDYAVRMKSNVTLKRLGFILEYRGVDIHSRIGNLLNRKYDLLNPLLPPEGEKNRKWRLVVNEVLEQC